MLDYSSVGPEAMDSDEEGMHDYAYIVPGFTSWVCDEAVRYDCCHMITRALVTCHARLLLREP